MSQARLIVELQQIDLEAIRLRKKLQELPQRQTLAAITAKLDEVFAKSQQVSRMRDDCELDMMRLSEEEDKLIEKAKGLEERLKSTSDFRMVENLKRDLEGVAKRRNKVEFDSANALERLDKITVVENQVAQAVEKFEGQKAEVEQAIAKVEGEAKDRLTAIITRRAEIMQALPEKLIELYESTRKGKAGIAVATLEDTHCSVCRVEIAKSRIAELRSGPPIAKCPNCGRILVVKGLEDQDV
ncbi:MAG: hypothetical protein K6G78_03560 [bacterium]|nr:hypothetical protein [bacterium]